MICDAEDDRWVCTLSEGHGVDHEAWGVDREKPFHTWPRASAYTAHLEPLVSLSHMGKSALIGLLGSHFVSHGSLDAAAFERLVAEAGAVS